MDFPRVFPYRPSLTSGAHVVENLLTAQTSFFFLYLDLIEIFIVSPGFRGFTGNRIAFPANTNCFTFPRIRSRTLMYSDLKLLPYPVSFLASLADTTTPPTLPTPKLLNRSGHCEAPCSLRPWTRNCARVHILVNSYFFPSSRAFLTPPTRQPWSRKELCFQILFAVWINLSPYSVQNILYNRLGEITRCSITSLRFKCLTLHAQGFRLAFNANQIFFSNQKLTCWLFI